MNALHSAVLFLLAHAKETAPHHDEVVDSHLSALEQEASVPEVAEIETK